MKINEMIESDNTIKAGDVLMIETDNSALVGVVLGVKDGAVLIEGSVYPLDEEDDNVIRSLAHKQAVKNTTPYRYNADLAADIPRYDSVKRRHIPAGFEQDNPNAVAYDRFEAVPVNDRIANVVGIAPDGSRVKFSTTTIKLANALADAYNRGGFTDQDIQKVRFDEVKQRLDPKCWKGYRKQGTKIKDGVRVNNCVKVNENMDEDEEELYYDAINHMGNLYHALTDKKWTAAATYLSELGMLYQEAGVYLPDAIDMVTDRRVKMHIEQIYGLLDDNKEDVIRGILTMIKTGHESVTSVSNLISVLEEFGAEWSELDALEAAVSKSLPNKLDEAEYRGRKVQLGKPMRGDVRKYKVFVKDPKTGNIKKVNFGDPNMEIRRDDPERRKSFRARHGCGTPRASDRTKAAYWSCRMWSSKPVGKILKGK